MFRNVWNLWWNIIYNYYATKNIQDYLHIPTDAFGTLPNVEKLDNCNGQGNNSVIKLVVPSKCTNLPTHSWHHVDDHTLKS